MIADTPALTAAMLSETAYPALYRLSHEHRAQTLEMVRPRVVNVVTEVVHEVAGGDWSELRALIDANVQCSSTSLAVDFDAIARCLHGERDTEPGAPPSGAQMPSAPLDVS